MALDTFGDCFLTQLDETVNFYVESQGDTFKYTFISYNDIYFKGDISQYEVIVSMRLLKQNSTNWNTFRLVKTDNLGLYFVYSNGDFNLYNIFLMKLPTTNTNVIIPQYEKNNNYLPDETTIPNNVLIGSNGVSDEITLDPRIFNSQTSSTTLQINRNSFNNSQTVMKFFLGVGQKGDKGQSQQATDNREYYSSSYNNIWQNSLITINSTKLYKLKFNIPNTSIDLNTNRYIQLKIWLNYTTANKPLDGTINTPLFYSLDNDGNLQKYLPRNIQPENRVKKAPSQNVYLLLNDFIDVDLYEIDIETINNNLYVNFGNIMNYYNFEFSYQLYSI